jgi:mono/diheme cytochrome c family protein
MVKFSKDQQRILIFSGWLTLILSCMVAGCSKDNKPGEGSNTPVTQMEEARLLEGKAVYDAHCATCHMADGSGAPPMNPPLIKTSFVLGEPDQLIVIILNGMKGVEVDGERYRNVMPGLPYLTDQEIADVLTYVRNSFGNQAGQVLPSRVSDARMSVDDR